MPFRFHSLLNRARFAAQHAAAVISRRTAGYRRCSRSIRARADGRGRPYQAVPRRRPSVWVRVEGRVAVLARGALAIVDDGRMSIRSACAIGAHDNSRAAQAVRTCPPAGRPPCRRRPRRDAAAFVKPRDESAAPHLGHETLFDRALRKLALRRRARRRRWSARSTLEMRKTERPPRQRAEALLRCRDATMPCLDVHDVMPRRWRSLDGRRAGTAERACRGVGRKGFLMWMGMSRETGDIGSGETFARQ